MISTLLTLINHQIVLFWIEKTGDGRLILEDDIVLRFRGRINTC